MLCGIGLRFKLLGGDALGRVSYKGSSENREQPVSFQATEALGRFRHACPAVQRSACMGHAAAAAVGRKPFPASLMLKAQLGGISEAA